MNTKNKQVFNRDPTVLDEARASAALLIEQMKRSKNAALVGPGSSELWRIEGFDEGVEEFKRLFSQHNIPVIPKRCTKGLNRTTIGILITARAQS